MFQISIIGLGLMGGSMGYALRGFRDCVRAGVDTDARACGEALRRGAVDRIYGSAREAVRNADLVIFCTFPRHIEQGVAELAGDFKPGSLVTELGGLKRSVAALAGRALPENVDYIGIHPMAGKETGGFGNADPALFKGTGFIITPIQRTRPESVALMRDMAGHIGAARVAEAGAGAHDAIIAYSSDLMHIASAALCMDYHPKTTRAFTAGAFRDCTRIANIDPGLWTELLTRNADEILPVLERHIQNLNAVYESLSGGDSGRLHTLLARAQINKKELDSR